MWPFDIGKRRSIRKSINSLKRYIISQVGSDIIALYVGGSILRKPASSSDIDIYGIMESGFNLAKADAINNYLKSHPEISGGREAKFKPILISELEGGRKKSKTARQEEFPILLRYMPCWKRIYGKRLDFSKFGLNPPTPKQELIFQSDRALQSIDAMRKGTYQYEFSHFLKSILHCAKLEAVLRYGLKYDLTYEGVVRKLKRDSNHIVHEAWRLRHLDSISSDEKEAFVNWAEKYLKDIREELLSLSI